MSESGTPEAILSAEEVVQRDDLIARAAAAILERGVDPLSHTWEAAAHEFAVAVIDALGIEQVGVSFSDDHGHEAIYTTAQIRDALPFATPPAVEHVSVFRLRGLEPAGGGTDSP